MAQGVHGDMHFGPFAFFMPVKTRPRTAFRSGLHRAAVQYHRAGIGLSFHRHAQDGPQVMRHGLKTSGLDPAPGLLVDHPPGRQIIGQHAPSSPHSHQVAQGIEDGAQGIFNYTINTPNKNLQILLYLGTTSNETYGSGAWDPVYEAYKRGDWSCQKLVDAHRAPGSRQVISGVPNWFFPTQWTRAYFWYFAVADCSNASGGLTLDYSLEYYNPGGYFYHQFSYDEQGVAEMYIFFTIFYFILGLVQAYAAWQLIRQESWHPIVRLLTITVGLQFVSSLAEMAHYLVYASNGVGALGLLGIGELTAMASQLLLMFLCLLVAKGWAITTTYLTDKIVLLIVMAIYFIAYLVLFIWDNVGRDPASTLYFYDSIPGLIVVILRLGLTGWFWWCLRTTIRLESLPEKRKFYSIFGICYTFWFILLPAIILLALALEPWFRFRTVRGLTLCADAIGIVAFIALLWPSRAARYFNIKPTPQLLSQQERREGYGGLTASKVHDDL